MIDPSTSDITGRGIETFSALGFGNDHPAVQRALGFLFKEQERDGSCLVVGDAITFTAPGWRFTALIGSARI
jgi:squalene cyclase